MSTIQTSLYLVAAALCLFTTGLTTRRATRTRPLRYFTLFLLIQAALFGCELLMSHPGTPFKSLWLALLMAGSLWVAPCLWLAIAESIGGEAVSLRSLPRIHWVLLACGVAATLPLMSTAHAGTTFANPARVADPAWSRFIHATMLICIGLFVVQVPWYLSRCRQILLRQIGHRTRHWARLPLAIVATSWLLAIVRTLDCAFFKCPAEFSLIVAVISAAVAVSALYLLIRNFAAPEDDARRYARSPLPDAVRARVRRKLERAVALHYKKSGLSLDELSTMLNESPHYVSQVINQDLGTSFHEFVNRHRIDEARRLLVAEPARTVLSIAMDVGFNSKSAFHTAFRRATGRTPTEYRASAGASGFSPAGQDDLTAH